MVCPKKAAENPEAQQRYEDAAAQFRTNASATVENTSDALRAKLDTLDLHAEQIKDELAKTGEVIRRIRPAVQKFDVYIARPH